MRADSLCRGTADAVFDRIPSDFPYTDSHLYADTVHGFKL